MSGLTSLRQPLLVVSIATATALAQVSAAEEEMDSLVLELDDLLNTLVETASRYKEKANSAPGTLVVITRRQIEERGYRNLYDLMTDLPSVDVQTRTAVDTEHRITMRGVTGNNKFVVLQDGVRISSPTGEPIAIADNFPLYHVKQVEVVYGPASALYGADAFTGVINLISEEGTDKPEWRAEVTLGEDNFQHYSLNYRGHWGEHIKFTLGAHFHESDNQDLSDDYSTEYTLGDLTTFGGSTFKTASQRDNFEASTESHTINLRADIGDSFTLGYSRRYYEVPSNLPTTPAGTDYGPDPHWITSIDTFSGKYNFEINDWISSSLQGSYSRYEQDKDSKFTNIFVDYLDGFKYSRGEEAEITQQFDIRATDTTSVVAGYTFETFDSLPKTADLPERYDPDKSNLSQDLYYLGTNDELPIKFFEVNWNNKAVFVQSRTQWSDKFSTTVGLRYDDSSTYGDTTNPRLGLVWQPQQATSVKLLYGEAFLAPAPFFSYEHFGSFAFQDGFGVWQSFFFRVPNSDLEPEEMETLELNISHRLTDNMNLVLTLYTEEVDGIISPAPTATPQSDFIDGGNIAATESNQNLGTLEADGGDLSLMYASQWGSLGVNIWGSYSWIDGELDSQGGKVELPYTAENKLKLGATFSFGNVFVSPRVHWVDDTTGSEVGTNIGFTSDDYTVVHLYAGIRNLWDNQLTLTLRVNNLLDEKYENSAGGGFDFQAMPQETRWLQLGAKFKF